MDGRIGINDRIVAVNCVNLTRATRQEVRGVLFLNACMYHNTDILSSCWEPPPPHHAAQNTNEMQQQGNVISFSFAVEASGMSEWALVHSCDNCGHCVFGYLSSHDILFLPGRWRSSELSDHRSACCRKRYSWRYPDEQQRTTHTPGVKIRSCTVQSLPCQLGQLQW